MRRSVLVTGANGFVGSHLCARLLHEGNAVHAVVRAGADLAGLAALQAATGAFHLHALDGSATALDETMALARPEMVFHLASYFVAEHRIEDVEPMLEANLGFGLRLLEAMRRNGVTRLVNTSTAWEHFSDEADEPVNLYAATKRAFGMIIDRYVDTVGLHAVTLKLYDTYGPGDRRAKLFNLLRQASAGDSSLRMSPGDQELDLVHVDDVAAAHALAAEWLAGQQEPAHSAFAVSSGVRVRLRDVVGLYERTTGVQVPVEWGARPYRAREVMRPWSGGEWVPGWQPRVSLAEGLKRLAV